MTIVFWDKSYVAPQHSFNTTRKSQDVADLVKALKPQTGIALRAPSGAMCHTAETWIEDLHDPEYIEALRTGEPSSLASSNGFPWDEGIWEMAIHSTGGILEAVDMARFTGGIYGSLSSGLHHANDRYGTGFCTINGLVVAAYHALNVGIPGGANSIQPAKRVLIVDYDAHCGGGTHDFLRDAGSWADSVDVVDLSTSSFDSYDMSERADDILIVNHNETDYMDIVDELLFDLHQYDLILYNAGVDPYPTISFDNLAKRDRIVFDRIREARVPCAFVLAGGYTSSYRTAELLTKAHMNTILAADEQVALSEEVLLGQD